jgi:hypothetical protein
MERSASVANIKCVNSNLWEFIISHCYILPHNCERPRKTPNDIRALAGLEGLLNWASQSVTWFPCPERSADTLPTGPGAILFGITSLIRGNGCGPCVPPVLFKLASTLPIEASISN